MSRLGSLAGSPRRVLRGAMGIPFRWKVMGFLGLQVAASVSIWLLSAHSLHESKSAVSDLVEKTMMHTTMANDASFNLLRVQKAEFAYVASGDAALLGAIQQGIEVITGEVETLAAEGDGPAKEALAPFQAGWAGFQATARELERLVKAGKRAEAATLLAAKQPEFEALEAALATTVSLSYDQATAISAATDSRVKAANERMIGLVALAAALGLLAAALLLLMIRPLGRIMAATHAMAEGDIACRLGEEAFTDDEVGRIAASFRLMGETLRRVIREVRHSAEQVAAASARITLGNQHVESGSHEQVRATEETAVAMEEMAQSIRHVAGGADRLAETADGTAESVAQMTGFIARVATDADHLAASAGEVAASIDEMAVSIRQVAGNAGEANRVAARSTEVAMEGRRAVDETMAGMSRIDVVMRELLGKIEGLGQSSAEIGSILGVIQDIAQQTNLLALNASIEAARAGEHGRGFAVVAHEVKALAQRSGHAAEEIGSLIVGIQSEMTGAVEATQRGDRAIREGTRLAETAGRSLHAIVEHGAQVETLMAEVAKATAEQARAADQIAQAVAGMLSLTTQVATDTHVQTDEAGRVAASVSTMSQLTAEVNQAMRAQAAAAERVRAAMDQINAKARVSASAASDIAWAAADLESQAKRLLDSMAFFKAEAEREPAAPATLTAAVPPAPAEPAAV